MFKNFKNLRRFEYFEIFRYEKFPAKIPLRNNKQAEKENTSADEQGCHASPNSEHVRYSNGRGSNFGKEGSRLKVRRQGEYQSFVT